MLLVLVVLLYSLFSTVLPLSTFQLKCLSDHNALRSLHQAPPLEWSQPLANSAQRWAEHLAEIDQMKHAPPTNFGESLFYMYGGDPKSACDRAVKNWYAEIKNYDFSRPKYDKSTVLFTQLVWKGTTHVGIGFARSSTGNFFLVARYSPSGNVQLDSIIKNVKPPTINHKGVNIDKLMSGSFSSSRGVNKSTPLKLESSPFITAQILPQKTNPFLSEENPIQIKASASSEKQGGIKEATAQQSSENKGSVDNSINEEALRLLADDSESPQVNTNPTEQDYQQNTWPGPIVGKDFEVSIMLKNQQFTDELQFPQTKQFSELKNKVLSAINIVYDDNDDYRQAQIISFRRGDPIIADVGLIFNKNATNNLDILFNHVKTGHIASLPVKNAFVVVEALPDNVLKLSFPDQPHELSDEETCPSFCSNLCFPGCESTCCSIMSMQPQTQESNNMNFESPAMPQQYPSEPYSSKPYSSEPYGGNTMGSDDCSGWCQVSCMPQCNPECCRRSVHAKKPMRKLEGAKNGPYRERNLPLQYVTGKAKNIYTSKTQSAYRPMFYNNGRQYYNVTPLDVYKQFGKYKTRSKANWNYTPEAHRAYSKMKITAMKWLNHKKRMSTSLESRFRFYQRLRNFYKRRNEAWVKRRDILHKRHMSAKKNKPSAKEQSKKTKAEKHP